MANLKESATWESGIYQLETTDPVVGGEDGIDNKQAKQLANRTTYLRQKVESLQTSLQESQNTINSKLDASAKAADSDKLDGLDSSAFARIEQVLVKRSLPKGDYTSVGFWRALDSGWYSYNHDSIQGSNNPTPYGFIYVLVEGSDYRVFWYRKNGIETYSLFFNGSYLSSSSVGWNLITLPFTSGSYANTGVMRNENGDFSGRRISVIHLDASIHVASQANPTIDLSKADNFEITLTGSGVLTLNNGIKGQSGVISIANAATNITGYASNIKWRTTPTNLQATETFAYFVWHDGYISIGRV